MDLDQPNELQPILEETMLRLAVVTMENERLVTQFTELKSENISLKSKAQSQIGVSTADFNAKNLEATQAKNNLAQKQREIDLLQIQIRDKTNEVESWKNKYNTVEKSVAGMSSVNVENMQLKNEIEGFKRQLSEWEFKQKKWNNEKEELLAKQENLKKQLDGKEETITKNSNQIRLLVSENERLTFQTKSMESQIASL